MADEEAEAVRQATDEKRLLPGEEPQTHSGEGAVHWVQVYSDLRRIKRALIDDLKAMMEDQSVLVRDELQKSDVNVLELQVQRFERRLAFWRGRLADLDGGPAASEAESTRREGG
ncbi:MAG: hypothetical protein E6I08_16565 [Chloroflexi bacterium]|nr:MAG: hypothetical protein E6I08_16565 [Chloroflexota bacterium]